MCILFEEFYCVLCVCVTIDVYCCVDCWCQEEERAAMELAGHYFDTYLIDQFVCQHSVMKSSSCDIINVVII